MSSNVTGVYFEKDANGNDRFVRFDMQRHGHRLQPLLEELGCVQAPEGWDDAMTLEEFAAEAKQMLRNKFDERGKDTQ